MTKQIYILNYAIDAHGNVDYIDESWDKNKKYKIRFKTIKGKPYVFLFNPKYDIKTKFSISTLVAKHFIDNPNNYKYVMHIDENYLNNNVENLKWACLNDYRLLKNKKLKLEQLVSTSSDENDISITSEDINELTEPRNIYNIPSPKNDPMYEIYKTFMKFQNQFGAMMNLMPVF